MDEFERDTVTDVDLEAPVLVEGLPGVGHVGKLAAEHILEELDSELVVRLYSQHFPPQVTVDDGVTELACVEFHAAYPETGPDLLVLTGDHQAQDNAGHYRLSDQVLDVATDYGVDRVFALGGVPTGELIDEYDVIAAVSDPAMRETIEDGVEFREDQPAGGIVGVSGLLLGLGARRGLSAACLMGETSGYLVDPKSARAVLEALGDIVGFDVGYDSLEERAEEMEEVVRKIQELESGQQAPTEDDLRYIG